ncbi:EamA family transporter RarD [Marinomonas sp. 15G1-11]|uniref:EamA family transporter RarD n=1 Tax=Marinomonas phaeophyticola TaxID=3004091 RepID=A0ABT4JTB9_9GAMM|nr:EamA family transporter RarD [Marinomonas sp. 15G1-11]MCZ2721656.1 EamA family transporter RarD [Marinomonas sp. 15G1-11]
MISSPRSGVFLALSAYLLWGLTPVYFKWVANENPLDIVANRVLWSVILLTVIITLMRKWSKVKDVFSNRTVLLTLLGTTFLIGINWSVFIYAVSVNRMLDASLGYYINPLMTVALGIVFLNERPRLLQYIAMASALIGVCIQIFVLGYLPWISIVLALSFSIYGYLHKKTPTDSFTSLFLETSMLLPFALLLMGYLLQGSMADGAVSDGSGPLNREGSVWLLLMLSGPITTLPLLLFSAAAKRVSLSTLGFLQYVSPSMLFGLAIFVYGEPFHFETGLTFAFIWMGLVLFSIDSFRKK